MERTRVQFLFVYNFSISPHDHATTDSQDEGDIILEGSRHPCVEAQDWVNFIPNDCKLVSSYIRKSIIFWPL